MPISIRTPYFSPQQARYQSRQDKVYQKTQRLLEDIQAHPDILHAPLRPHTKLLPWQHFLLFSALMSTVAGDRSVASAEEINTHTAQPRLPLDNTASALSSASHMEHPTPPQCPSISMHTRAREIFSQSYTPAHTLAHVIARNSQKEGRPAMREVVDNQKSSGITPLAKKSFTDLSGVMNLKTWVGPMPPEFDTLVTSLNMLQRAHLAPALTQPFLQEIAAHLGNQDPYLSPSARLYELISTLLEKEGIVPPVYPDPDAPWSFDQRLKVLIDARFDTTAGKLNNHFQLKDIPPFLFTEGLRVGRFLWTAFGFYNFINHLRRLQQSSAVRKFFTLDTLKAEAQAAKNKVIDLNNINQYQRLLRYACKQIETDKEWAAKNSIFINQLLYRQAVLLGEYRRNIFSVASLGSRLQAHFFRTSPIHIFAEQTREIFGLDPHLLEAFVFSSEDGQQGISMAKTCYEKNVHRMVHTQPMVNADIANGTITHRLHTEPDVIRDPALELAPFPLLLNCYLKTQYPLPKLLSTLNLGAYQPLFEAALMTRIVKSELKMVSPHHTEELNRIFSPLVQDLFSKRPMLTTAHFQTILDTFKAKNISKQEQAYLLFCLSASFVRYSSKLGFGTDNDSPFVVRSYAAALLHQASMQYPPSSATLPKIEDYQNRLLGIKGSLAFSCTHALFLDMHDHVKKSRDRALQETFDFVIPPIWR